MSDTTAPAPAPVYTVWNHVRYTPSTDEVWSGEDFGQALQAALDAMGGSTVLRPLDAANAAALQKVGGRPLQAWVAVDADDVEHTVFITR
jgi:hypothetical protein